MVDCGRVCARLNERVANEVGGFYFWKPIKFARTLLRAQLLAMSQALEPHTYTHLSHA